MVNEILTSIDDVDSVRARLSFLDGRGGTGKTFLYNTVISVLLGREKTVISVGSTGKASTLLTDGATYHSAFKIYPPITEATRSRVQEHHYEARMIRGASLIISDEATMKLSYSLNAIDHLFRKLFQNMRTSVDGSREHDDLLIQLGTP